MKINVKKGIEESIEASYGNAYVCEQNIPESLTGKIFEVLELAGLTDKQEESAKRLIRKVIWDSFGDGVFIGDKTHTAIREKFYQNTGNNDFLGFTEII